MRDEASIRGPTDLKNEIQIITLSNNMWEFWERFLMKHSDGELIDPVSLNQYKDTKGYKAKNSSLNREFFRHCGRFTDLDYKVLAQHLLAETPGRKAVYPKVTVPKNRVMVPDSLDG